MRLAGLLAVLSVLLAAQLEALGQASPPPPRTFGPDSTRTGVFTGEGTATPGLSCQATAAGGRECSGFLASAVDGTLLDVTVAVPPGAGLHSLVVVLHGWGGSKGSFGYIADPLLADGHAVLRYSTRGFGKSWGQVNLSDIDVELEDLRSMIKQVVDDPQLPLNPDAVAITGASYGGGQSWLALLQPSFRSARGTAVRIRTVVPIVPWTDLLYSLLPNGRPERSLRPAGSPKLSYINGLFIGGLRDDDPERPYPNYPDYLVAWQAWIDGMEPNRLDPVYRQIVDGIAGYRSIWWQEPFWRDVARNRVPVFQVQGLTDDLFPLPEAKRMLLALKSIDPLYPIASYFGDVGHPRASNKPGERDYMIGLMREWLAFYLQGKGVEPPHVVRAAITRPRDQAFSATDVITVDDYAQLATRIVRKRFAGSASLVNPLADPLRGFAWDPLVMEASGELQPLPVAPDSAVVPGSLAVFTVPVAELAGGASLLIAGQPLVSLRASTLSARVQLNVRLIDVAPDGTRQLITRGTFILQGEIGSSELTIPTYGNVWEAGPDHVLRLEITNVDSPYLTPSRIASVTQISQVRLEIPAR
jgi:pimeloyl-ACP methyl ester carboxylesterase